MATKMANEPFWTRHAALIISSGFLLISGLYILFSDQLLLAMGEPPERLTELQTAKGLGFIIVTSVLLYIIIQAAMRAIRRSAQSEYEAQERYRRMIDTTNEGVWIVDKQGQTTFVNQTMAEMLGTTVEDLLGRPESIFLHDNDQTPQLEQLRRHENGEKRIYECAFVTESGDRIWTMVSGSPLLERDGTFVGVLRMITDITDLKKSEAAVNESLELQRQLLNELDHRIRNNLASLISLVDLSHSTAGDVDTFAHSIRGRIDAMSRAYGMLSASRWQNQDLHALLQGLVPSRHSRRVHLEGPTIRFVPYLTSAVSLVMHELMDNAIKFGSLSGENGTIDLRWRIVEASDADVVVEFTWKEQGGPPPVADAPLGAGLELAKGLARSDLRGSAECSFPEEGASHVIRMRLETSEPTHSKSAIDDAKASEKPQAV